MIHSGSGKNAADLRLCIDALDLAHRHKLDGFAIASSDGDFGHLAHYLRETGFIVIGIGEAKTPQGFRLACTRFEVLQPTPAKPAASVVSVAAGPASASVKIQPAEAPAVQSMPATVLQPLDRQLRRVILDEGTPRGMELGALGQKMRLRYSLPASSAGTSGWGGYVRARGTLFACDPKGPNAWVRWIGPGVSIGA